MTLLVDNYDGVVGAGQAIAGSVGTESEESPNTRGQGAP